MPKRSLPEEDIIDFDISTQHKHKHQRIFIDDIRKVHDQSHTLEAFTPVYPTIELVHVLSGRGSALKQPIDFPEVDDPEDDYHRMLHGIEIAKKASRARGTGVPILYNGGVLQNEHLREALKRGIFDYPKELFIIKPISPENTIGQAKSLRDLLESEHYSVVAIVSSAYHLPRISRTFGKHSPMIMDANDNDAPENALQSATLLLFGIDREFRRPGVQKDATCEVDAMKNYSSGDKPRITRYQNPNAHMTPNDAAMAWSFSRQKERLIDYSVDRDGRTAHEAKQIAAVKVALDNWDLERFKALVPDRTAVTLEMVEYVVSSHNYIATTYLLDKLDILKQYDKSTIVRLLGLARKSNSDSGIKHLLARARVDQWPLDQLKTLLMSAPTENNIIHDRLLYTAIQRGDLNLLHMLSEVVDLSYPFKCEEVLITPLLYAMSLKKSEVITALLETYRVNPRINTASIASPLSRAISEGSAELTERLLKHGADANDTFAKELPLVEAISQKRADLVGILLRYGANMHQKRSDHYPKTPLEFAEQQGDEAVLKELRWHQMVPVVFAFSGVKTAQVTADPTQPQPPIIADCADDTLFDMNLTKVVSGFVFK